MTTLRYLLLWLLALGFTLGVATYQRQTGPTYPIEASAQLGPTEFTYSLKRTHGGEGDHPVEIKINDSMAEGLVIWKRYKLDEPLQQVPMVWEEGRLVAYLPHQPPAGKLEYKVLLRRGVDNLVLPSGESAVIRFKGAVPAGVLIPHILSMFAALLMAARTALAAIFRHKTRPLAWVTLALVVVGGLILGPIVQRYAFGAFWTGWPLGEDLTDNKTAVMALAWLIAIWRLRGESGEHRGRWWTVGATVVTFTVFLIPHSMHGSELDWSELPQEQAATAADMPLSKDGFW